MMRCGQRGEISDSLVYERTRADAYQIPSSLSR